MLELLHLNVSGKDDVAFCMCVCVLMLRPFEV